MGHTSGEHPHLTDLPDKTSEYGLKAEWGTAELWEANPENEKELPGKGTCLNLGSEEQVGNGMIRPVKMSV